MIGAAGIEASFNDGIRYGLRIEGAFVLDGDSRNAVFDHVYVHASGARNFADFFTHAHGAVVAGKAGCFDGGDCHDGSFQKIWNYKTCGCAARVSAAHHAGYYGGCLFDFLINDRRITCTFGFNRGVGDAMPHMFFEQG